MGNSPERDVAFGYEKFIAKILLQENIEKIGKKLEKQKTRFAIIKNPL
ncbi:hypothetical protein HpCK101_32720 [Helicobacter pylori]